jgi:hypothetical protein
MINLVLPTKGLPIPKQSKREEDLFIEPKTILSLVIAIKSKLPTCSTSIVLPHTLKHTE